ncbi:MAG: polyketide synthase Pks13 [Corynebacterium sp.]|nr:polyketide synthase Pks13 [Corynebacterium sp.]
MTQHAAPDASITTPHTTAEWQEWVAGWIQHTTGLSAAELSVDAPLQSLGLSSRDVVILAGEIERTAGINIDATVAYQYPTIAALAAFLSSGGPATQQSIPAAATPSTSSGSQQFASQHDIAIVGMAGRYPGAADTDEMWRMFLEGRDGLGPLPVGRWSEYAGDPVVSQKIDSTHLTAGYLDDIADFDAEFFGLSPVEAANMDPQQRIMLELTWRALEHANIAASKLRGAQVGVYVGSVNNDYGMLISADPEAVHPYAVTGNSSAIIPNRISYAFDFRGPSISVDTACSSSLVATHQAVRDLRNGDADVAIAGGINIMAHPFVTTSFGTLGVLSPTGKIHAFSDDADGFVRSDGAGVLVLKRVADAVATGDRILAVIKGSAVNSDGHSNGLTAPNPDAQIAVLQRAYADAGVSPTEVDFVDAHGTGTILGDPIEAQALGAVLGAGRRTEHPLLLASAKTNFGHTESAAGSASLIKTVLAMQEDVLPASLHFNAPNPYIDFDANHLEVIQDPREWPEYSGHKLAGVSGFGFGGTNAHVVLSDFQPADYPELATPVNLANPANPASPAGHAKSSVNAASPANKGISTTPEQQTIPAGLDDFAITAVRNPNQGPQLGQGAAQLSDTEVLLPVSGLVASRMRIAAHTLASALAESVDSELPMIARSLAHQNQGRARAVVQASTAADAVRRLELVAQGKAAPGVSFANGPQTMGPVFVYSGFGSQHRKMAKELYELSSIFAARLAELDEYVQAESGWSAVELILDDSRTYDTESAQVVITVIQIALTDFLAALGARPAAVMGMSMGEIAAAYAAGGLSAEDALRIASHRSRLMGEGEKSLSEDQLGAMALVEFAAADLDIFISENPEFAGIEPAVYAGPGMTTVGGPRQAVKKLVELLESQQKFARLLDVKGAGHTSAVDPIMGELSAEIADIQPQPLRIPLFSSVDRNEVYPAGALVHDADYFLRCTRQPVWFSDATTQAFAHGHQMLVEISAHPVALMAMMNTAFAVGKADAQLLFTLKRKVPATESIHALLAKLYVHGSDIDFARLVGRGSYIQAPGMQFKHQAYWTSARPSLQKQASLPGTQVVLSDGLAFSTVAENVPSLPALLEAAVQFVNPEAQLVRSAETQQLPASGELTTIVRKHLGGLSLQVYRVMGDTTILLGEGVASEGSTAIPRLDGLGLEGWGALGDDTAAGTPVAPVVDLAQEHIAAQLPDISNDGFVWDPASGESVEERLRAIVSESMGYDAEDLPGELPLIDLGLDSLMGMRIKNRIEHDFQIPPLQVQALRDASVADVVHIVEDLVAKNQRADSAVDSVGGNAGPIPVANPPISVEGNESSDAAAETSAEATIATFADTVETLAGRTTQDSAVPVAPRDAAERLVFATWANITGAAVPGIQSPLPVITEAQAQEIAERLHDRSDADVKVEQVLAAGTLESLGNIVRESLETEVEGNVRVLRARPADSHAPAVFMFHPAGGSSVVYQPLTRRLPAEVPVYGIERLEGELRERAAAYLPEIVELAAGGPIIVGGWSFGGALAYEVVDQLRQHHPEVKVAYIALLDTVKPRNPAPDTIEETVARWYRYAAFAKKTYGLEFEVPTELLRTAGEAAMLEMVKDFLGNADTSATGVSAGVLEHQRASFVDNRILDQVDMQRWAQVNVPVILFRAERMHDGAIELEPAYADIAPDGGWAAIVSELEIVQLHGDHLAVVDEPEIATVGKVLSAKIAALEESKR